MTRKSGPSRRAKKHRFTAAIEEGRGGGALVRVPFDVREEYGTGGQVRVKATFDGEPYRGSLAPMGGGTHVLGIRKAIREKLGKGIGDVVKVVVEQDLEERVVEVPEELRVALRRSATAKKRFDALSYTHRREHAEYVSEAKRPETRERRARKTVERLLDE